MNAQAVCLQRLGRNAEAVDILRSLVYGDKAEHNPRNVPFAISINFATALLTVGDVQACERLLRYLCADDSSIVKNLRDHIQRWEHSLSFWQRSLYHRGRLVQKPVGHNPSLHMP